MQLLQIENYIDITVIEFMLNKMYCKEYLPQL